MMGKVVGVVVAFETSQHGQVLFASQILPTRFLLRASYPVHVPSVGPGGTRSATSSGASCSLRVHSDQ